MESRVASPVALDALRLRALAANLELVRSGLAALTFGNASAADREAGLMAIKPSGIAYDELAADAMPVLDIVTGEVVAGELRPSSDTPTHLVLYRAFPRIGGIVHTHSRYALAWAQALRPIPCLGTTHADHFRGDVPVTRRLRADEIEAGYEEATGAVIVETIAARGADPLELSAVLVASHGPFVWADDAPTAVENALALELVAEAAYRSLRLDPDTRVIDGALLAKHFERKHGPSAYYGQDS